MVRGGSAVKAMTFRAFPRWLLVAEALLALVATPAGLIWLIGGEPLRGVLMLAMGLANAVSAAVQFPQRLTVSGIGLSLPDGFRRVSVRWSEIQRIQLDSSSVTRWADRQVLLVESQNRGALSAVVLLWLGRTRRPHTRLERELRRHADVHGFEFAMTNARGGPLPRGGGSAD